jgi:hypothetical protein
VFGGDYIIKTAKATEDAIWQGLSYYLYLVFIQTDGDDFASDLAIACAAKIMCRRAATPEAEEFSDKNKVRVEREILRLNSDHDLCEILSGAAYNIGYGRYVALGGSTLFNRYLRFIRTDTKAHTNRSAATIRENTEVSQTLNWSSIEIIRNLQNFGLWIDRSSDPNELEYCKAAQTFAAQQLLLVKHKGKESA